MTDHERDVLWAYGPYIGALAAGMLMIGGFASVIMLLERVVG